MKWYLAKLVYQIICGDGAHTPQFDEQLRLIAAAGGDEAFVKAAAFGQQEEGSFHNQKAQLVCWQCINVAELYELPDLADGAELYSRIQEVDDAAAYTTFVHHKAAAIRHNQTITCFI